LRYAEAATHFANAAAVFPPKSAYEDERISYLQNQAAALFQQGDEFGDNGALLSAIEQYTQLVNLMPREREPRQWAWTQYALGLALLRLGERESGTAKLEEAVVAFREALKEQIRELVPLEWAPRPRTVWALRLAPSGDARAGRRSSKRPSPPIARR
jgi:tetratricopeptide (TPR) repeat protein